QKLESLGVLAGGIAHDFNNLLTAILGHAELAILDLDPDTDAAESLETVRAAAMRATELTRQLLAYAGRAKIRREHIELAVAVPEMMAILRTAVPRRAALELQTSGCPVVEADVVSLRQVIMNLVMNAGDALNDNAGTITISTRTRVISGTPLEAGVVGTPPARGVYAEVEVRDDGCGMSQQTAERIFDPFFTTKETGHGLGLAAAIGLVTSHGGSILVRSIQGEGTDISLLIPESSGAVAKQGSRQEAAWDTQQLTGTVLLVDDSPEPRQVAQRILERAGLSVVVRYNGLAAVEYMASYGDLVDLAMLDLSMPGLDGTDVLARIREGHPRLPAILSSGLGSEAQQPGFDGFIAKPYHAENLVALVRKLLQQG
ncbi:MAG: response regulator, partial [Nannocystaceae bacterium]|nr:response regulator [Nannocystaceae bacterium]